MRGSAFLAPLMFLMIPAHAATRFVATNGSDSNAGTTSSPFLTFNKCYQVSSIGDVCLVRAGSYGSQNFDANSSIAGGTDHQTPTGTGEVTFRPETNTVSLNPTFASSFAAAPVEHIAFEDMSMGGFPWLRSVKDTHFTRVHFTSISQWNCADYVSVQQSEFGAFTTDAGDGLDLYGQAYNSCNFTPGHWLVETSTIHGVSTNDSSAHPDAIALDSGHGVIIRRNKFYNNCGTNLRISAQEPPSGIVVENNMMAPPVSCAVGAALVAQIVDVGTVVRYNTFDGAVQMGSPDSLFNNELWEGNIITGMVASGCPIGSGTISRYNVWSTSNNAGCGTNNVRVASFSGWFVNPSVGNYDLTSANPAAVGAGNPASFPALDLDGHSRPSGGTPDAGASEFGGTTSSGTPPEPPTNLTGNVN